MNRLSQKCHCEERNSSPVIASPNGAKQSQDRLGTGSAIRRKSLRGVAEAILTRLLHFVRNDTSCQIAALPLVARNDRMGLFRQPVKFKNIFLCLILMNFVFIFGVYAQEQEKSIDQHRPSKNAIEVINSAQKLSQEGKVPSAIKLLEDFTAKEDDPVVLLALGNAYFVQSQYEKSVTIYKRALSKLPIFPQCRKNLGKAFFALNQYKDASEEFRTAISQDKEDSQTLLLLGQCYYLVDNTTSALEVFRRLLVLEPEAIKPRLWIIYSLLRLSRYDEATTICEETLKLYPTDKMLLEILGSVYVAQSRFGEAIDVFKMLELLGKLSPEKLLTLADLYMNQQMYSEAAETYDAVFKLKPPGEDNMFRLAQAKWLGGDSEGGLKVCNEILKNYPQNYKTYLLKGQIFLETGKDDDALKAFQEVNSIKADVGETFLGMGEIYLKRKDLLQAKNCFLQASKIKETKSAGFAGLGEISYANGNIDESIKYYQEALSAEPGNKDYYNMLIDMERLKRYQESTE